MTIGMKTGIPMQVTVALAILVLGGGFLGTEYFLVRWYPRHQQRVSEETLKLLPYRNDGLGIEMQVAAGIYGKVESSPGSVKIFRSRIFRDGPSLTVTSQPNPDARAEFSPQVLAVWQTDGVEKGIPRYTFEHTAIMGRDAVLIWQSKNRTMTLTARVISPDRIVEADCSVGSEDEALFMQACEASVRTLKVAGPEPGGRPPAAVEEVTGPQPGAKPAR
jgi:hypothetical protein